MRLPNDSVGISDIVDYRECPRRMSWGMRRHVGPGEQTDTTRPELAVAGAVHAREYGSAAHELLRLVEEGHDDEQAVELTWRKHGRALEPSDLALLRRDLETYRRRDFPNTRTLLVEEELRVPLLHHDGRQIFFRARIDRLYERLDRPGHFLHVDYKTSKWPKSEEEVDSDLQMWAYNWVIHEVFPECDDLSQWYDQLSAGQIPTNKTAAQRAEIRDWIVVQVKAILADNDLMPDGLLRHSYNEWCPWCPIMESCPVVADLTDFAATRIAALAPERPKLKKDGTPSKRMEAVPLEPENAERYTAELARAKRGAQVLGRFVDEVNDMLRKMPEERREQLGFDLRPRRMPGWSTEAARDLHARFGDQFYELVKVTKRALEAGLSGDDLDWALQLAENRQSAPTVVQRRPPGA